ncbi:hypothetical protein SEA_NOSHOW_34 [Mycobacterium phage NoShow]|nr:hypothetical protein SEA_NOSHOW_34 [Mycobacterium phage NoShow]
MAAKTATKSRGRTTKKAAVEEDLDDEDLDTEVEDTEEDEEPAPRKSRAKKAPAKKAAPKVEAKGTAWLREHVSDKLGQDVEATKLRIILRKLIKDGTIESPKDGRYQFTGVKDPNVVAVIAALRDEAKSGPAKRGRKPKAKVADEVDESEDEVEDLDLDDDDDDE